MSKQTGANYAQVNEPGETLTGICNVCHQGTAALPERLWRRAPVGADLHHLP